MSDAAWPRPPWVTERELKAKIAELQGQLDALQAPKRGPKHLDVRTNRDDRPRPLCGAVWDGGAMTSDPAAVRCLECTAHWDESEGASHEGANLDPLRANPEGRK